MSADEVAIEGLVHLTLSLSIISVAGPTRRSHLDTGQRTPAEGKDGQGEGRRGAKFGGLITDSA